ncbi:MAG: small ribosomal subunit Rsm22 family protein [Bryobacteraceae bacterium]|nr:small ribosomal subunit Rsm22 family protein [Bryobacteraceae bacterium]
MQLPADLRHALEQQLQGVLFSELQAASQRLTEQYRAGQPSRLHTPIEQLAYAAVRMPATYAAVRSALSQFAGEPRTLLDLGAGPGTATWAAHGVFPSLQSAQLLERNRGLVQLGQRLGSPLPVTWSTVDLAEGAAYPAADLVIVSYALNEVKARAALLAQAWQATAQVLALVEPGTPAGFRHLRAARDWLLNQGGFVAAPCPHASPCPMMGDNWCHFAARVERSSLHRRIKGGDLGYEDEKFSYLLVTREPARPAVARIIRHPQHKAGYVQVELCTATGLEARNVPKSAGEVHRHARKASWGDAWSG